MGWDEFASAIERCMLQRREAARICPHVRTKAAACENGNAAAAINMRVRTFRSGFPASGPDAAIK